MDNRIWRTPLMALLSLSFALASVAGAQGFPNRPIRLIVPFAAGGGNDMVSRILAQKLSENIGQQVVVENRPGGNTLTATELVAHSPPDGHTLIMQTNNLAVAPSLYKKLPYDTFKDLAPVGLVAGLPHVLVVHPGVPAATFPEFVALAKAKPGSLNYASAGSGTVNHLAGELLKSLAGIDIRHIPYKGGSAPMPDLLSGRVEAMFAALPVVSGYIKEKRLRALAVTTSTRVATLPDVPTIAEMGYTGYEFSSWFGVLAAGGTPSPIVEQLSAEITKAIRSKDLKGLDEYQVYGSTPQEFAAFIRNEVEKAERLIRASGATVD